jgi:hypothetical protein
MARNRLHISVWQIFITKIHIGNTIIFLCWFLHNDICCIMVPWYRGTVVPSFPIDSSKILVHFKAQNKWCRIAICYPNFRNCYTKLTSDLQFATQNYTQTNKKCEELLYKFFFSIALWKISKIATHRKKVILSPAFGYICIKFLKI